MVRNHKLYNVVQYLKLARTRLRRTSQQKSALRGVR